MSWTERDFQNACMNSPRLWHFELSGFLLLQTTVLLLLSSLDHSLLSVLLRIRGKIRVNLTLRDLNIMSIRSSVKDGS